VLEETAGAEREQLLASLQEGATVKGIVKNITDYGAFVDLGGIDGLLPHHRPRVAARESILPRC